MPTLEERVAYLEGQVSEQSHGQLQIRNAVRPSVTKDAATASRTLEGSLANWRSAAGVKTTR